jgi:hypothetical protein
MLPLPHIPDQVLFGSSGYPLRIEAGLTLQLNTSVNGGSRIFTGNKSVGRVANGSPRMPAGASFIATERSINAGRFRGNAGTTNQRMIQSFRGNVAVSTEPKSLWGRDGVSKCRSPLGESAQ